jgi:hypothetical protein
MALEQPLTPLVVALVQLPLNQQCQALFEAQCLRTTGRHLLL